MLTGLFRSGLTGRAGLTGRMRRPLLLRSARGARASGTTWASGTAARGSGSRRSARSARPRRRRRRWPLVGTRRARTTRRTRPPGTARTWIAVTAPRCLRRRTALTARRRSGSRWSGRSRRARVAVTTAGRLRRRGRWRHSSSRRGRRVGHAVTAHLAPVVGHRLVTVRASRHGECLPLWLLDSVPVLRAFAAAVPLSRLLCTRPPVRPRPAWCAVDLGRHRRLPNSTGRDVEGVHHLRKQFRSIRVGRAPANLPARTLPFETTAPPAQFPHGPRRRLSRGPRAWIVRTAKGARHHATNGPTHRTFTRTWDPNGTSASGQVPGGVGDLCGAPVPHVTGGAALAPARGTSTDEGVTSLTRTRAYAPPLGQRPGARPTAGPRADSCTAGPPESPPRPQTWGCPPAPGTGVGMGTTATVTLSWPPPSSA